MAGANSRGSGSLVFRSPSMQEPPKKSAHGSAEILLAEGNPEESIRYGEARVLACETIGTVGKLNVVGVRLEIVSPVGETYEMAEQWIIPGDAQSCLQVGVESRSA